MTRYLGLALAAACALAYYVLPPEALPWGAGLLTIAGLWLCFVRKEGRRFAALLFAGAVGLGWFAGHTALFVTDWLSLNGQTAPAEVTVVRDAELAPGAYGRWADAKAGNTEVSVFLPPEVEPLKTGDVLTFTASVRAEGRYPPSLRPEGAVLVTRPERVPVWLWPEQAAQAVKARLRLLFPEHTASLLSALLLGDDSGLPDADRDALNEAGLSHVVAVSGLHVSMLAGFVLLLTGRYRRRSLLALPVIAAFVLLAGAPPSAVRAGIMQAVFLLGGALGRDEDSLSALNLALLALLLQDPRAIADLGLQLSFASALGILLYAKPLGAWLQARKLPLSSGLAVTLSALIFSAPILAVSFGKVSVIAPLSNLLGLWAVQGLFLGGAVLLFLSLFAMPAASLLSAALTILDNYLITVSRTLAGLPFASVYTAQVPVVLWLGLCYALLLILLLWKPDGRRLNPWLFGGLTAGTLVLALVTTYFDARSVPLELTVLDVGQGQSVLLCSDGKAALIDCGSQRGDAARAASEALRAKGLTEIDTLVLTHGHYDHASGVQALTERVPVQRILAPEAPEGGYAAAVVERPTVLRVGRAELYLLPPLGDFGNPNERCLSVFVRCGDFAAAVTGDLDAAGERALRRTYDLPRADVLVAGHHGADTSTSQEWLDALQPSAALISVGENGYGHPSPGTLNRLALQDVRVYRTDRLGSVTVRVMSMDN